MTRLVWVAENADLEALCGFAWDCGWRLIGMHLHTIEGDCLLFSVSLN